MQEERVFAACLCSVTLCNSNWKCYCFVRAQPSSACQVSHVCWRISEPDGRNSGFVSLHSRAFVPWVRSNGSWASLWRAPKWHFRLSSILATTSDKAHHFLNAFDVTIPRHQLQNVFPSLDRDNQWPFVLPRLDVDNEQCCILQNFPTSIFNDVIFFSARGVSAESGQSMCKCYVPV